MRCVLAAADTQRMLERNKDGTSAEFFEKTQIRARKD
jgi:hypothetical protein